MEKILTIDGKQVPFKSSGAFLLRYKMQFKRDAVADLAKLQAATNKNGQIVDIGAIDLEVFFNMVWTLAKIANPTIPPPMEWLDSFSEFPIIDILPELIGMIQGNFTTTVNPKKK